MMTKNEFKTFAESRRVRLVSMLDDAHDEGEETADVDAVASNRRLTDAAANRDEYRAAEPPCSSYGDRPRPVRATLTPSRWLTLRLMLADDHRGGDRSPPSTSRHMLRAGALHGGQASQPLLTMRAAGE